MDGDGNVLHDSGGAAAVIEKRGGGVGIEILCSRHNESGVVTGVVVQSPQRRFLKRKSKPIFICNFVMYKSCTTNYM